MSRPPTEARRCTCPSGDGSLRWPCPAHPPEAQPVAWEWEYIGVDQYPRGHKVARSLREMDPTNPPYPETWRPTRPLIYGDTAPPSAPVGAEELVSRAISQGKRLQWSAVMDTLERLRGTLALAQQTPAEAQPVALDYVPVKRSDLLRWAEDFARDNDPGDDTDVVTPFDAYLLQPFADEFSHDLRALAVQQEAQP